ncbi:hypothetical protein RRG08_004216 [Elysia crispata]|uniref:Uncharacterized protein n=1 Tax=Elysia crispata TaxID=231223 RepID=A0AAE1DI02_9GAST|nr:hypothetical protein RRG08_004216 [Elysia crispata]
MDKPAIKKWSAGSNSFSLTCTVEMITTIILARTNYPPGSNPTPTSGQLPILKCRGLCRLLIAPGSYTDMLRGLWFNKTSFYFNCPKNISLDLQGNNSTK